jgi:hypothetical protein
MARSFGRVLASIWDDEDFRALTPTTRLVYVFLLSQPDLDHAGVIPLRERRWGHDLAFPVSEVTSCLKELAGARFAVVDEDTEELLVRSLVRRDEVWRQPNVFKSAAASAIATKSAAIKAGLLAEILRLDLSGASREIQRIRDDLATHLEPFGNPSPTPPERSSAPSWDDIPEPPVDDDPGITGDTGNGAGQNPSGTLSEAQPGGTSELRGKGSSYGPVPLVSPSPFPFPPPRDPGPGSDPRPLWPFAVADDRPGEGDRDQGQTKDQLVATVRRIRPDWSTKSIERALDVDAVTERPWDLVCAAMLAVARDPASKQPGRLAHDGPWWPLASVRNLPPLPAEQLHPYSPDSEGTCHCGLPETNRHHQESA